MFDPTQISQDDLGPNSLRWKLNELEFRIRARREEKIRREALKRIERYAQCATIDVTDAEVLRRLNA